MERGTPDTPEDHDWDSHWSRFASASTLNPGQQMRHKAVLAEVARLATGVPDRIVDVGSGHGDMLERLREAFPPAALLGLELSRSGVEMARRKVPDATVIEADLFQPPAKLDRYRGWGRIGVCSEVLEHVDDPVAFIAAAGRYFAPGSPVVVTVPGGPMSAFDRYIGHRQHFTREKIRAVLEQAGYSVDSVRLSGFPFFNAYRLTVILRGRRLAMDIAETSGNGPGRLAVLAMAVFRFLFRFNLGNSPFGWQVIAVARTRAGSGS